MPYLLSVAFALPLCCAVFSFRAQVKYFFSFTTLSHGETTMQADDN